MNTRNEPIYIQLGDDEDEDEYDEAFENEAEEHDDDGVEVIRPKGPSTRGRGLRSAAVEEEEILPPSKTKIKKQMHELRDLGMELTQLGKDQIAQLDIPENLRDAIREMKNINSFGAQRRQMQYIGKLMRDVDTAPILAKLDVWKGKSNPHIAYMHQLERWRDRLMEDDTALNELLCSLTHTSEELPDSVEMPDNYESPGSDEMPDRAAAQRLRTLIRNAQKERDAMKPPKNFREIFQVLRELIPEPK
jgi:ribosome-associated protein